MSSSPSPPPSAREPEFFAHRAGREPMPVVAWGVAGAVILLLLGAILLLTHRHATPAANVLRPLDPYAASLPVSQIVMSESTSLSGGKSTFIDGTVRNTGGATLTAVTVQVVFKNDDAMPPQVETVPLALIRTRQPYVDTQPVSAAPIGPGEVREFRLIFESIGTNWNQSLPEIRVVKAIGR